MSSGSNKFYYFYEIIYFKKFPILQLLFLQV
nr:MAG TPA: hypothetical protein [Caudoviricetes sp.]